ncbi:CHAD domain-containing protein [Salinigranum halophilum]|uniref:CHAD domain-containing protein n=1 Tax=Salinigranum halophilum TaxID=2565931 RepID=UPI00137609A6|nr:CHAD domain-containing protein [Salinigranum halophilum]
MEYTIQPDETVSSGIKRIIRGKVDTGIDHIDSDMERHETVHEVRKRCKEVRAALRLVRGVLPTYSSENAHYRDAARRVSDIRDAQALIETFDDHVTPAVETRNALDEDTMSEIRAALVDRRETMAMDQDLNGRLEAVRADLVEGRERVDDLPIATEGFDAVAGGLRKSYKRARNRMGKAYEGPEMERFHEWRKRVKYHRYHSRLLRNAWVGPMKARRSELKTLSDLIGDEHDLAVFLETMESEERFDPATRESLEQVIMARRSELQRKGRPIGERLFAEEPDELVERMRAYWMATQQYEA